MFESKRIEELERQLDYANQENEELKAKLEKFSDLYDSAAAEIKRLHSVIRSLENED